MKGLYKYIREDMVAMPENTMGTGNPIPAGEGGDVGSEPLPRSKSKKQKRKKSFKKSLLGE